MKFKNNKLLKKKNQNQKKNFVVLL